MICKNCQTENSETASFCIKCGYELKKIIPATPEKSKYGDTIIIIISIFLMFNKLFWIVLKPLCVRNSNWEIFRHFDAFSNLIFAAIPILLAFIVKNKVWRIILIISGGIYALISLISIFKTYSNPYF